jgi:hypothetical protein
VTRRLTAAALLLLALPLAAADDKPADAPPGPSAEPKDAPLELKLVSETNTLELDARGDPIYKFQENIKAGEKSGERLAPTRVEMALQIKNTGKAAVQVWVAGDATLLTLDLKGNGAMTASARAAPPRNFFPPRPVTLKPGQSYKIPLERLAYGFRNEATYAYVADLGVYELTATFRTGVSPAPGGSKALGSGFGEVTLKSAPLTLRAVRPS